ncbi:uncharacterized protein CEXT_522331 [Caerostris extrusa]|uniref:Uncharacterized protein n=1 Tax=Caerostris extrusa TaxID=172846 RepID=A0AAV4M7R0_CAEEX|nr:uncharacterized protein CEXT_522331 [Caerostris extrusa]
MEKTADTHQTSCNFLEFNKMSKVKKVLDDAREQNNPEIDLVDKGITSFEEMPALMVMQKYNEINSQSQQNFVSPVIANMPNLESLNLFNNHIEDLPTSMSSLPKLKILNLGMNRLSTLPRGFGAFPQLRCWT